MYPFSVGVFLAPVPLLGTITQKDIPPAWTFHLSLLPTDSLTPPFQCFSHVFRTELMIVSFKDVLFPIRNPFCLSKTEQYPTCLKQKSRVIFDTFPLTLHVQLITKSGWFYLEIYIRNPSLALHHHCHQIWDYFSAEIQSPNWPVSLEKFKHTKEETVVGWTPMYPSPSYSNHQHKVVPISSIFTLCSTSFGLLWSKSVYQSDLFNMQSWWCISLFKSLHRFPIAFKRMMKSSLEPTGSGVI